MCNYEDDFTYCFLKKQYGLNLLKEIGICLENLCAGLPDKDYIEKYLNELHTCIGKNEIQVKQLYILYNDDCRAYLYARWILRNLNLANAEDDWSLFVSKVEKHGNYSVISNDVVDMIKRCIKNAGDIGINKFSLVGLNSLLQSNYFNDLNGRQFYLFLNLWKIVKALNPKANLIGGENKKEFAILLRDISKINASNNINRLARLDLSYCDFSKEDLSETIFNGVNMRYCNFQSAYLNAIDLGNSDLSYSKFDHAFMECSYLDYSNCTGVSFAYAHLLSSVVSNANFTDVSLKNTNFMECDADRLIVNGLKIDNHTVVNNTDFSYVDWNKVDISGISISDDQVNYFWEVVNCTRNTVLYDSKFKKLDNKNIQDVIYKECKRLIQPI